MQGPDPGARGQCWRWRWRCGLEFSHSISDKTAALNPRPSLRQQLPPGPGFRSATPTPRPKLATPHTRNEGQAPGLARPRPTRTQPQDGRTDKASRIAFSSAHSRAAPTSAVSAPRASGWCRWTSPGARGARSAWAPCDGVGGTLADTGGRLARPENSSQELFASRQPCSRGFGSVDIER